MTDNETYMAMWDRIRNLTNNEVNEWLKVVGEPAGIDMDFDGITVVDTELKKCLDNSNEMRH